MSDDLISRKALRRRMYHEAFETDNGMQRWDSGLWIRYKIFENAIEEAPAAQPTAREITTCAACRFNKDGKCRLLIERDPEAKDHRIYSDFWCAYGEK